MENTFSKEETLSSSSTCLLGLRTLMACRVMVNDGLGSYPKLMVLDFQSSK